MDSVEAIESCRNPVVLEVEVGGDLRDIWWSFDGIKDGEFAACGKTEIAMDRTVMTTD